ncbi:hypothetical protein RRU94_07155 [Domibacillus sp. DTU_2020_1001157_1_SI_ALB_TIR_016]|uniref:hypothetical protein n=1 Tax=Domibacillus sp. DTU_2020_1001157_1_SI_ALB_TIR_016 TaxID=3077789 RepID=UPI0028EE101D|nr:hypothetical protein [Domibacillus sp. DTU_2020_1001157_1_SI_ALB_TIR_016]WNS78230.1 hypothetical protein RRU94_07155 [Domibacillus sp. DTU_2020_1001157_1_SI_ALB_TIR_016]
MKYVLMLLLAPVFMVLIGVSAGLSLSAIWEEGSDSSLFGKIESLVASESTGGEESGFLREQAISKETLHSFSMTDWDNFTPQEKMRFVQTALPAYELTGQTVLDKPEGFIGMMDARYEGYLTNKVGPEDHTDLSELSLFHEMELAGQQDGRLEQGDDH